MVKRVHKTSRKTKTKPKKVTRKPKTKSKKTSCKTTRKTSHFKKVVQRGGIPDGGTSFGDLPNDLIGLVEYTVNSVVDFVEGAYHTLNIGSELGAAFNGNVPNPDTVKISGDTFD